MLEARWMGFLAMGGLGLPVLEEEIMLAGRWEILRLARVPLGLKTPGIEVAGVSPER